MKALLLLDTPLWLILTVVLTIYIVKLRRQRAERDRIIEGLNNPVAFLPEKEQADWARDLLAQEKFERNTETINEFNNRKW